MKLTSLYCVLLYIFFSAHTTKCGIFFTDDPDMTRNVTELVQSKGYPVENHVVQTKDGYILQVQRIPNGRSGEKGPNKQVAFIQHGILSSSSDWVINFPEQSLSFILADAGYDVWLGNSRGNVYSKRHVEHTPDMAEFWNFSFDEYAMYDVPAVIDYILEKTKQEQLFFIGYSQGSTTAFAMLSESLEYNEKIKLFVALSPVAAVGHISGLLRPLALLTNAGEFFAWLFGVNELLPKDGILMPYLSKYVCDTWLSFICEGVIFLVFGADYLQLNTTRLGVYSAHAPAGTSTKSIFHYGQLVLSKKFAKYDYGSNNQLHYNQTTPPEYNVSKITTPVALICAENDYLGDSEDVSILRDKLRTVVEDYTVPYPAFNHLDFAIALEANRLIYDKVLQLLKQYN